MDEYTEEKWRIKMNPTVIAMRMYDVYPIAIKRMKKWFFVQRALNPIIRDVLNRHAIVGYERGLYYSYSRTVWRHTFKYPEYLWDRLIEPIRDYFIRSYKADPKILDEIWSSQRHIMRIIIHKLKTNRPATIEPYTPRKPWEIHTKIDESWLSGVLVASRELDTTSVNKMSEIEALTKKDDHGHDPGLAKIKSLIETTGKGIGEVTTEITKLMESNDIPDLEADQSSTADDTVNDALDINALPEELRQNPDIMEVLASAEYYFGNYEGVVVDPKISRLVEDAKKEIEEDEAIDDALKTDKSETDIMDVGVRKVGRKRGRPPGSRKAMGKAE
jgi:hypothetical protein